MSVVVIDLIVGSIASTDDPESAPRCSISLQLCRLCVFDNVVVVALVGSVDVEDTVVKDAAVTEDAASSAIAMSSEIEAPEREDIARVARKAKLTADNLRIGPGKPPEPIQDYLRPGSAELGLAAKAWPRLTKGNECPFV